jgi:branched-chain amino acid transport system permease protein
MILIFGILALSLDLIWGYGGLLSFGQTAMYGIGAYTYAVSTMNLNCSVELQTLRQHIITCYGGDTYVSMLLAVLVSSAFAAALGYTLFYARAKGVYFAIITLADTAILQQAAIEMVETRIGNIPIGGWNGIVQIPRPTIGIPGVFLHQFKSPADFYYLVLFFTLLSYFICKSIVNAPFGKVLRAIKENEARTSAIGYDVRKYKLIAFTISGALAGLAGMLYASWGQFVNPEVFSFLLAGQVVIWVLVGGKGTLIGPFIGAAVTKFLEILLGSAILYHWLLALGLVFIILVLRLPNGIYGGILTLWRITSRGGASD